jgi:hypothetical protein
LIWLLQIGTESAIQAGGDSRFRYDLASFVNLVRVAVKDIPQYRLAGALRGDLSPNLWVILTDKAKPDPTVLLTELIWKGLPSKGFLGTSTERLFPKEYTEVYGLDWSEILQESGNFPSPITATKVGIINPNDQFGLFGGDEWIFTFNARHRR